MGDLIRKSYEKRLGEEGKKKKSEEGKRQTSAER